jgi:hypothetical protein
MPYNVIKVKGKYNCYRVINRGTNKIFSKCSTRKNAIRQSKLLRAILFNKTFIPNSRNKTRKNRKQNPIKKKK